MAASEKQLSETQAIIRLIIFLALVFLLIWGISATGNKPKPAAVTPGSPNTSSTDLKVEPSSSTAASPQQATSPNQASTDQVQSGQPNLQPAQTGEQMPNPLKQELGL